MTTLNFNVAIVSKHKIEGLCCMPGAFPPLWPAMPCSRAILKHTACMEQHCLQTDSRSLPNTCNYLHQAEVLCQLWHSRYLPDWSPRHQCFSQQGIICTLAFQCGCIVNRNQDTAMWFASLWCCVLLTISCCWLCVQEADAQLTGSPYKIDKPDSLKPLL